jgi:flotillin
MIWVYYKKIYKGECVMLGLIIPIVLVVAGALVLLFIISYIKAAPDTALIVSGIKKEPKVIVGGSGFRIPFLQRVDKLHLGLIQIDVRTQSPVPTKEFIDIFIDGVSNIKISKDAESIKKAMTHFLNLTPDQIMTIAKENLEGTLREIVGQMQLKPLIQERDQFAEKVMTNAKPDMDKMGLEIVNFTVQNLRDEYGAIQDLGIDNLAQIQKVAQIAKANAEKEVRIEQAKADELGNKARAEADASIARQNRDLEVTRAQLKREEDEAKAKADAAMEIESELQQRTINVNAAEAEIAKQDRLAEVAMKEISVTERKLDAEVKKKADADRYAQEQQAEADKRARILDAEAKKEEALREGEAIKAIGEAEAAAIRAKGQAEAAAIRAMGEAEAAAIDAKAEAMKKMESAAVIEMVVNRLPQIAEAVAKPLENVDSIVMYDPNGTTKLAQNVTATMDQVFKAADTAGVDIKSLINGMIGGAIGGKILAPKPEEEAKP